ncbi:MAG TPA: type II secretion system major pseudopilin GspG [Gemmatimonadales bacterium]|nr:type II secretion system major pseudopilin GspG [Gemmatimonadales bacterium]
MRRGFTLIELLVVILIIAILAALIVPRIVGRGDEAKVAAAKADISSLRGMLHQFKLDTGRYPSTEEGLQALRVAPSDVQGWKGPYADKDIPLDPWQHEYVYQYPGTEGDDSFLLISYGADGAEGGEGNNADIGQ